MCKICLDKLTACYLFRELCYQTHERLGQLYQNGNLPYSCVKGNNSQLALAENSTNDIFYKQEVVEKNEIVVEKTECANQDGYSNQYNDASDGDCDNYGNESGNYEAASDYKNSDSESSNKNFGQNENFYCDIQNSIEPSPDFTCSECTKVFRSKYTLFRHMKIHSNTEKLRCSVCNKQFTR